VRTYNLTQIGQLLEQAAEEADREIWQAIKNGSEPIPLVAEAKALERLKKHLRIALYEEEHDGDIRNS
jgi:hypothetical protein